ncbi:MAG TPA: bifunctional riboflavin kinase/FAD synthetase [Burkholderiaceae bacterium]|nr:bifunctional riboflavin kinase/FAD synthetase [Burkholderiaceae bacterium]HQR71639.1 bifunctional riboflavin kinase/FAD synthetase [Burkholderiaceae bacterium]
MQVFRGIPRPNERAACALTIGNFDGVHRGHQALLARVVAAARARGIVSAVMTFEPHPRELFTPDRAPMRISGMRDKLEALADHGIDRVIVQHFNRSFAAQSADAFVDLLIQGCRARWVLVGDDFRFGARRAGDVALLQRHASHGAFELEQMPTVVEGEQRISSSAVRHALAAGDLGRAAQLLGRAYAISGRVLHGRKLGREMGFPTMNLRIAHRHPAVQGVFVVRVHGLGPKARPGVASVGLRPTIEDSGRWMLEVHLFDFAEHVYGRLVRVEFMQKLRDEVRYASIGELTAAIADDARRARAMFDTEPR